MSASETLDLRIKCVSGRKTRPCCVEGDATGDGEIKDVFCFKYSLKETGASSSTAGERSLEGGAGNTMFGAYITTAPQQRAAPHIPACLSTDASHGPVKSRVMGRPWRLVQAMFLHRTHKHLKEQFTRKCKSTHSLLAQDDVKSGDVSFLELHIKTELQQI